MCYHVSQQKKLAEIKAAYEMSVKDEHKYVQAYHVNGFEKQRPYLPVISCVDPGTINMYRWRLVPSNIKDESKFAANTLNARNHDLFVTPSYRDYWKNRCLVICTGYFEPHSAFGYPTSQSWYIKPKDDGFITLGAIFSKWNGICTFSIITTDANPRLDQIHNEGNRMPLVLDGENAQAWLKPDLTQQQMTSLMVPYPNQDKFIDYRVLDGITDWTKNTNVPQILEPYNGIAPGAPIPMFGDI